MADLNALIAQGYQFQAPPDPFAQYGKMQQLQEGQQANQLNQMKMQEYQRGMEETNAMRKLDPASATYLQDITRINPEKGFAFAKLQQEGSNLKLTGTKTQMDIAETKRKLLDASLRNMASNPSDENIKAHAQDYALNPLFANDMPSILVNAEQLLKMTPEQRKLVLSSAGATAGDLSTAATAKAGQAITMRGQNMVDARAKAGQQSVATTAANRLAQDKQGLTYQTDVNGNIVALPTSMRGGVMPTSIPITGATGEPIKAKLSPYAEKAKTEAAIKAKEISSTIQELQAAVAPGGLIERSTGSGAGALIDAAAGFVGQSTKGAEAAAALAPIYDKVLKTVPRFEGPQSDKDTASYNKAAGDFANPAIPKERKLIAAKEILRLLQKSVPATGAASNLPSGWSVEVN